ncbi:DUF1330 domain-containing protein [Myxococcota bacterium]|nr:DUF1330 domain-containing protein [Myxococcota bacterium]
MIALYPTKSQIETLLASPETGPVVMLNLLRFKDAASEPDDGMSGAEAYQRYADRMRELVEGRGGRFLWLGHVDSQVIGEGAEGFQVAALVEYPSRRIFVEITTSPAMKEIGVHRAAGLDGQWLLATTTTATIRSRGASTAASGPTSQAPRVGG